MKYMLIAVLCLILRGHPAEADPASASRLQDAVAAYQRNDFAAALNAWQPLADAGNAEAQDKIGMLYANGRGVTQDHARAIEWYRKAADQGNADAQLRLAFYYLNGSGSLPRDLPAALGWLQKSAEQNLAEAQFRLGLLYLAGPYEIPHSPNKAAEWYRKAADQGYQPAQTALGMLYAQGLGVERDKEQALFWLHKASDQGGVGGQLAAQFATSVVNSPLGMQPAASAVQHSFGAALVDIRKGAERGDPMSERDLGNLYSLRGFAGSRDDARLAIMWWQKAADQGDAGAMNKLAQAYAVGSLVPRDEGESTSWARKAAEKDDPLGEMQLGRAYAAGVGLPQDKSQALFWFRKAEAHGGIFRQMADSAITGLN